MSGDPLKDILGPAEDPSPTDVMVLDPNKVYPWDICEGVRKPPKEEDEEDFRDNLKQNGIQSPVWVAATDQEGVYSLIAGYRRWAGAKALSLPLPAIVKTVTSPDEARMLAVIENTSREDLGDLDMLKTMRWLMVTHPDKYGDATTGPKTKANKGANVSALARVLGMNRRTVAARVQILNRFTDADLDLIDNRVQEDAPKSVDDPTKRLDWVNVQRSVLSRNSDEHVATIMQLIQPKQESDDTDGGENEEEPPPLPTKDPSREIHVKVKAPALESAGVTLKIGSRPADGVENITVTASVSHPFKVGKVSFTGGVRGDKATSKLFADLAAHFQALSTLGVDEKATEEQVEIRSGLKSGLDAAYGQLAQKCTIE